MTGQRTHRILNLEPVSWFAGEYDTHAILIHIQHQNTHDSRRKRLWYPYTNPPPGIG